MTKRTAALTVAEIPFEALVSSGMIKCSSRFILMSSGYMEGLYGYGGKCSFSQNNVHLGLAYAGNR